MSRMLFIADVHLTGADARQRQLLEAFLDRCVHRTDRLYILGDLFDFWANNRILYRTYGWVFEKLGEICRRGAHVGLLIGNRDFLLRKRMVEDFGMEFLGEEASVSFEGKKFFLSHGHLLCLDDLRFLYYRGRMWPLFRALDRILPGPVENRLAVAFQQKSKQVIRSQDPSRFSFTRSAIEEKFLAGFDYIICGHTHQAESFACGSRRFFGLPSFCDSPGAYLLYDDGNFIPATLTL